MNKEELKTNYERACNNYLKAFCEKHEFDFDTNEWIAGRAGEVVQIADYYVDMATIIDDIELDAPESAFLKWYDYCTEMRFLGAETTPNFRSWIRGCPRKSEAEIVKMKAAQQRIEELKRELINSINDKDI
jgi:hypothetical protein